MHSVFTGSYHTLMHQHIGTFSSLCLSQVQGGGQQWWVGGAGASSLPAKLARHLQHRFGNRIDIRLNAEVSSIHQGHPTPSNAPTVRVTTIDGSQIDAHSAIVAVPPTTVLRTIRFSSDVSDEDGLPHMWTQAASRSVLLS